MSSTRAEPGEPHPSGSADAALPSRHAGNAGASVALGPTTPLTIEDVDAVAHRARRVHLSEQALAAMAATRDVVERQAARGLPAYGITTGFGDLSSVSIPRESLGELQLNILRSHAAGTGPPLPEAVVRAMMLLRAQSFAIGSSGVRAQVADLLVEMLNRGITPVVPSWGSVGTSGDLAPLAHLALVLVGEGEAWWDGRRSTGREALAAVGLAPLRLEPKEGLALVNGTQLMAGVAALAAVEARRLIDTATLVGVMSVTAMQGTPVAFHPAIHEARPHRGQLRVARMAYRWLGGRPTPSPAGRVQDALSLRCIPQVHGAVDDAVNTLADVAAIEVNAATDNPLVFPPSTEFPEGAILSGGNSHGQPVAIALDLCKAALTDLASISERRVARLVDPRLNGGLPAFLAEDPGLGSGYMIAQYTAAALVNELQVLASPSSIHSIPTSANQEDHNSMGANGALQLREVLDRTWRVVTIEALVSAQGIDFLDKPPAHPAIADAHACVRATVPHLAKDRVIAADLDALLPDVRDGRLLEAALSAPTPTPAS